MRVEVEMCVIANILRLDWSRLSNTFQDYGQLESYDSRGISLWYVTALLALPVHHAIKFQFERIGICRRLAP